MGLIVTRRGQNFLLVGIFLGFLVFGLSSSKWGNSVGRDWEEIDIGFSSLTRDTETPYIKELGDIDGDLYNEFLIYDNFEKSMIINRSADYLNETLFPTKYSFINESIHLLNDSNYLDIYGKSSIGAYTLNQNDPEDYKWKKIYLKQDIMKCEIVPDINGDEINDIIISAGIVKDLPNLIYAKEDDYTSLYLNNNSAFTNYFNIDIENDTLLVTPIYKEYKTMLISGKTGKILDSSDIASEMLLDRCIIDIVILNNTENTPNKPDIIVLSSKFPSTRFYSPIYHQREVNNRTEVNFTDSSSYTSTIGNVSSYNYEWKITAIKLKPFRQIWEKNLNYDEDAELDYIYDMDFDYMGFPSYAALFGDLQFTTTINGAKNIDIEASGNNFIIRFTPGTAEYHSTLIRFPFNNNVTDRTMFGVYNASTGDNLWKGNNSISFISKNLDLTGNNFGQINGYYISNTDINYVLYNPINGNPISKSRIPYNSSWLLRYDNLNNTEIMLSDDDAIGNDGILEIISLSLNESHYQTNNHIQDSDPAQFVRLNMNTSSNLHMIISPITDFQINLWEKSTFQILSTNVDFNGDDVVDYIFTTWNTSIIKESGSSTEIEKMIKETAIISGMGNQLNKREPEGAFSFHVNEHFRIGVLDFRRIDEITIFRHDPVDERRINLISSNMEELIFIQDVNNFKAKTPFMEFFVGADILIYILGVSGTLCVIGFFSGIKKRKSERKYNDTAISEIKSLSFKLWIGIFLMLMIIGGITYFFVVSIDLTIGYTTIAISPEGQLIWFLILYPAIFGMLAFLPELYNSTAPYLSEKFFINPQRKLYTLLFMRKNNKKKDYRIILINMEEKYKMTTFARISRMLLPILISFTVGTFIYQGLGVDGAIYQALAPNLIDRPLTNPNNLGIITPGMTNATDLWIEIGKFARYCIMPMIITYVFTTLIIPGAWLLDDVGVCFYEKALLTRAVSDIDSISKFFLNSISGFFGFTAIISFVQLFIPMLTNINELTATLALIANEDPLFSVLVLIGALIIFPIFAGLLLMISAQQKMEVNYENNAKKLKQRLVKNNIDITPLELSAVLDAKIEQRISDANNDKLIKKNQINVSIPEDRKTKKNKKKVNEV